MSKIKIVFIQTTMPCVLNCKIIIYPFNNECNKLKKTLTKLGLYKNFKSFITFGQKKKKTSTPLASVFL